MAESRNVSIFIVIAEVAAGLKTATGPNGSDWLIPIVTSATGSLTSGRSVGANPKFWN
jgi:hypothetical protein